MYSSKLFFSKGIKLKDNFKTIRFNMNETLLYHGTLCPDFNSAGIPRSLSEQCRDPASAGLQEASIYLCEVKGIGKEDFFRNLQFFLTDSNR